jgi:hypothetical protein
MDFPSAVEEIVAIQKKCAKLQQDAAEIAQRTEKVSLFLCKLIGRKPEKDPVELPQLVVLSGDEDNDGSWRDVLISDLKENGKSYTSDILERIKHIKKVRTPEEEKSLANNIRTNLARFRKENLVKSEADADGIRMLWEAL